VYLAPGLTPEAASRICMHECRAQYCRGPLLLSLTAPEVLSFRAHAAELGVELTLREADDGSGAVAFPEHDGERCPMLDDATSVCRIYADRPHRCREFPDKLRPGCAISGGCVTVSAGAF
jgi:Fe-S-cluster containining protein